MKMRILMFGWEFPPYNSGGLGVACLGLTRALSARGAEITFVMPKKLDLKSPWARMVFADESTIAVRTIDSTLTPYLTSTSYARGRELDSIYGYDLMSEVLRYARMGGEIAQEEQFDVIYAHDWLSFGAGMEAKRISGKPLVAHVHATEFDRCGGAGVTSGINHDVYEIEKAGMEAADVVIAVSQLTKNIIVNNYGIPESKVRVVYNGIDETTAPVRCLLWHCRTKSRLIYRASVQWLRGSDRGWCAAPSRRRCDPSSARPRETRRPCRPTRVPPRRESVLPAPSPDWAVCTRKTQERASGARGSPADAQRVKR